MVALFNRLGCVIGRHSPSRRSVQYRGSIKTGPCKHCGTELQKRSDGRWVAHKRGAGDAAVRED